MRNQPPKHKAANDNNKSPSFKLADARELRIKGKDNQAARLYSTVATALVDAGETDSKHLADAYLGLMGIDLARAHKNKNGRRNLRAAVAWYDLAIDVYRERDDARSLSANLTNMSALLFQAGQLNRAIEAAHEGLEIAESLEASDPRGDFRLAAWNHYAGYCRMAGQLDEAEKTLKRGLSVVGEKSSNASYLLGTLAEVYENRAALLRSRSTQLAVRGRRS